MERSILAIKPSFGSEIKRGAKILGRVVASDRVAQSCILMNFTDALERSIKLSEVSTFID